MLPRILILLAGALMGGLATRKKLADGAPWCPDIDDLETKFSSHHRFCDAALAELRRQLSASAESMLAELGRDQMAALEARLDTQPWRIELAALAERMTGRADACDRNITRLRDRVASVAAEAVRRQDLAAAEQRLSAGIDAQGGRVTAPGKKVEAQEQSLESTWRIVVALDELITGKVADLDKRLQAQSRSIDALNTTVAQTDDLLERVLDSIQALPHAAEEAEPVAVAAGSPPATEVNDETDLGQIRQSRL